MNKFQSALKDLKEYQASKYRDVESRDTRARYLMETHGEAIDLALQQRIHYETKEITDEHDDMRKLRRRI